MSKIIASGITLEGGLNFSSTPAVDNTAGNVLVIDTSGNVKIRNSSTLLNVDGVTIDYNTAGELSVINFIANLSELQDVSIIGTPSNNQILAWNSIGSVWENKSITESMITDLGNYALSSITISAGTGLTGGGNLTSNRTISLNIPGLTNLSDPSIANNDTLAIYNTSAATHEEATISEIATSVGNILGLNPINGIIYTSSNWTDNVNGTITLPTVDVVLYDDQNWTGSATRYTVTGATTGTGLTNLTDETINYIYIDYNTGSPQWVVTTSEPDYNRSDRAKYVTLYRAGNFLHILDWEFEGSGLANKLLQKSYEIKRFERATGLAISTGGSVNLQVNIAAGVVWNGINRTNTSSINSWDDIFFSNYHTAGTWDKTVYGAGYGRANNTYYDNGTDLTTLGTSKYVVNWYYKGVELGSHVYEVIGRAEYDTVSDAQLETPPTVPELVESHAILVGRIITQEGSNVFNVVESAFDIQFASSTVSAHNDLTGIQGGTGGEYYHLTNTEHTYLTTSTFAEGTGNTNKVAVWLDSNTLTYDDYFEYVNGTLSITADDYTPTIKLQGYGNLDSYAPVISTYRHRGSFATPSSLLSGDDLFNFNVSGRYDATSVNTFNFIKLETSQIWSSSNMGTKLTISTIGNDNTLASERIVIQGGAPLSGPELGNYNYPEIYIPNQLLVGTTLGTQSGSTGRPIFQVEVEAGIYYRSGGLFRTFYTGSAQSSGVAGQSTGASTGSSNIGLQGIAGNNSNYNVGVSGLANEDSQASAINIGGEFEASGGTNGNYSVRLVDGTEASYAGKYLKDTGNGYANWSNIIFPAQIMCSDLDTAITTGKKAYWSAPSDGTISDIFATLDTVQSTGSAFTVDIRRNGTTIFSQELTFDNSESSTLTATTGYILGSWPYTFTKGDKFDVYVTQVGDGTAKGLLVTINYVQHIVTIL